MTRRPSLLALGAVVVVVDVVGVVVVVSGGGGGGGCGVKEKMQEIFSLE